MKELDTLLIATAKLLVTDSDLKTVEGVNFSMRLRPAGRMMDD
jgi:hypothetical protein